MPTERRERARRSAHPRALLACAALVASLFGGARASAQPTMTRADPPHVVEARARFDEGAKLAEVGRYDDALSSFARSHALRPHAVTTYNMATCERALSHY